MVCKNCGTEFEGKFCSNCGQAAQVEEGKVLYCTNCGSEINGKFCSACGQSIASATNSAKTTEGAEEKNILETKAELYLGGLGRIVLTSKKIVWNKSKKNIAINILSPITLATNHKGDTVIPLSDITHVDTYTFLAGGGLKIFTKKGKKYRFGFYSKEERDIALEYINSKI